MMYKSPFLVLFLFSFAVLQKIYVTAWFYFFHAALWCKFGSVSHSWSVLFVLGHAPESFQKLFRTNLTSVDLAT